MTVSTSINAFGLELLRRSENSADNCVLSPASIALALGMTWAGARGDTAREMQSVLGLPGTPALGELARTLATPSGAVLLKSANRLFAEKSYRFEPEFLSLTSSSFGAPLQALDFVHAFESARETVNRWVEEQTERRIVDLVPRGGFDAETRLALVNAIYFLAKWEAPFESYATSPAPFHLSATEKKDVATMHQMVSLPFAETAEESWVELPYRGGSVSMLLAVPKSVIGLGAVERSLDGARLARSASALRPQLLRLALPKFEVNPSVSLALRDVLIQMGIVSAFDRQRADFTGIANPPDPDDRLYIGAVFHKAFVRVDEEGTEAAAATAVSMPRAAGMPPKAAVLAVDRPFLFFIRERESGLVLFAGRVVDPTRG